MGETNEPILSYISSLFLKIRSINRIIVISSKWIKLNPIKPLWSDFDSEMTDFWTSTPKCANISPTNI